MKMNYKNLLIILIALIPTMVSAQIQLEWQTINSGEWDDPNPTGGVWRYYKSTAVGWIVRTQANGPDKGVPKATVTTGIDLVFGTSHKPPQTIPRTFVQTGATLKSKGDSLYRIKMYGDSLNIDGQFGGPSTQGLIDFQIWTGTETGYVKNTVITGAGLIQVYSFTLGASTMPLSYSYYDTVGIMNNMTINDGLFSLYANSANNAATDNLTMTIAAGKTVTLLDTSAWHMRMDSTTKAGGTMIYNILGTLDMSQSIAHSNLVAPSTTATATVAANVSGIVKLGRYFTMANSLQSASSGKVLATINTGGRVDAMVTQTSNAAFRNAPWIMNGGNFRRVVSTADTVFPMRTGISVNNSLTWKVLGAPADTFSAGVRDGYTATWPATNMLVNKEWSITKSHAAVAGALVTGSVMWTSADQNAGFSATSPVSIYVFTGARWKEVTGATVTGAGTAASPYMAQLSTGLDSAQKLVVGSAGVTLPTTTGIHTIAQNGTVNIMPNPVTNGTVFVTLNGLTSGNYAAEVVSATGQKIAAQSIAHTSGSNSAYIINLPAGTAKGMYYLNISGSGFSHTTKLSVQ